MSTPVIESIAENIKTTIDGITVANGYNQTLVGHRPRRIDFADENFNDKDVLIVQTSMEATGEEAIQTSEWYQHFDIVIYLLDSDQETATIDTRLNAAVSDIIKALMVDRYRGTYAIDTRIHGYRIEEDGSGVTSCVILDISVHYGTKFNDPYTVR